MHLRVEAEVCSITTLGLDQTDVLGNAGEDRSRKVRHQQSGSACGDRGAGSGGGSVKESFCSVTATAIRAGRTSLTAHLPQKKGFQSIEIKGMLGTTDRAASAGGLSAGKRRRGVGILEVLMEKGYGVTPQSIADGLKQVRWPGRFQFIHTRPEIVIDGAHNPQSAHQLNMALRDYLKDRPQGRKTLVIGMSSDKDIGKVAAELAPLFSLVIATRSRHPRALDAERLAACFSGCGCEVRKAAR
jgi:dihydrofolate synthase/folylpolyglutamate synthase